VSIMTYSYIRSEPHLWTTGFYRPDGKWEPESDHDSPDAAAHRAAWLNSGQPEPRYPDALYQAIQATPPGHNFADRELLNIIRLGLSRIYTAPSSEASPEMQECARQALSRLEGRASLSAVCKCCVDNECECEGRKTGPVTRTGEIIVTEGM